LLEQNFARFGALGLRTEMDVGTAYDHGSTSKKFADQAVICSAAANACQNSPTCWKFTTWGFTDKYTSLGSSAQPLPFDQRYNPKPRGLASRTRSGSARRIAGDAGALSYYHWIDGTERRMSLMTLIRPPRA
jgi:GH35 family endo-1,4-beta-xylanase